MKLVTEDLAREAIYFSLPTVRLLCEQYTWGPKGVVIAVACQSLPEPVVYIMEELGPKETWKDTDGTPLDFEAIAREKATESFRTGHTTQDVVTNKPWLLKEGDSLYRGGVAKDDGLAVAASGSYGEIDETIAWIVFNVIAALCHMKLKDIMKDGSHTL